MKGLHGISFILLIIGGLNWGLIGLGNYLDGNWNVVGKLLGGWSWLESLVYLLVGIAAVLELLGHKKLCKNCDKGGSMNMGGQSM